MSALLQPGDPVILLLRVSSTRQKTAESIQTQDEQLRKYCSAFPLVIHAVFEDNGVSGTSFNRDGLEAALAEARKGTTKAILVWNLARLTRADELDDLLLRKELREMRMPPNRRVNRARLYERGRGRRIAQFRGALGKSPGEAKNNSRLVRRKASQCGEWAVWRRRG